MRVVKMRSRFVQVSKHDTMKVFSKRKTNAFTDEQTDVAMPRRRN